MTDTDFEFHSPLTLLSRWEAQKGSLNEVLITGYTHDLVFLERFFVPRVRGLGARLTVLADAGQAVHDPVDVRHAGRVYQHANVTCAGAFHPKLVVFVGEEDVWVAIGSGNPTLSGWGHNNELWLDIRATRQHGPSAFEDLAIWLTQLPSTVAMPTWAGETLLNIATMIRPAQIQEPAQRLRILGNLDRPIVDQLPVGPVLSLGLSAPFYDERSAAVGDLVDRLRPGTLTIAVQPGLSHFHGESLVAAVSSVPEVSFRAIDESRTSHGKLIEWHTTDSRIALVGSPNLSRAALLTSTRQGGNCELAVTYSVSNSLLPDGVALPSQQVRSISKPPVETNVQRRPPLTLLGARRVKNTIQVELVVRHSGQLTLETSPTGGPGSWQEAHTLSIEQLGQTSLNFQATEVAGAAIRGRIRIDGTEHLSSIVFLTDTVRCQPQSFDSSAPRLSTDYTFDEVIGDPALAEKFHANLLRLMNSIAEHRVAPPSPSGSATHAPTSYDDDRWGAWISDLQRTIGPSLAGLLFPRDIERETEKSATWSVDLDSSFDIDDADELTDVDEPTMTDSRLIVDLDPSQHDAWRRWAGRLRANLARNPHLPLEIRMLVVRLHLNLLAAGLWGPDDEWRTGFSEVLRTLRPSDDELDALPALAADSLCTMIAVGLALLFQDASLHGGTAEDAILRSAWDTVGEWASYAGDVPPDEYVTPAARGYSRVAGKAGFTKVIELARDSADDPRAQVYEALTSEGIDAEFHNGAWVSTVAGNPRKVAAKIATLAGDPCAVIVFSAAGNCSVIRSGNSLALGEARSKRWRIYEISAVGSPMSVLGSADGLPSSRENSSLKPPSRTVEMLAQQAQVNLEQLLIVLTRP